MLALVLSLAVAFAPHGASAPSAQQRAAGHLPARGVLVVGKSIAGVKLGMTQAQVKTILGGNFTNCITSPCNDPTFLYFYPSGEPLGMGVRFNKKTLKAVAIFTLGAVTGWRSSDGLKIADPASKVYDLYGSPRYSKCIGYEALSVQQPGVVTSFYLTSGVVYSYALTMPGATVCQ
jgi:hypothetical protein